MIKEQAREATRQQEQDEADVQAIAANEKEATRAREERKRVEKKRLLLEQLRREPARVMEAKGAGKGRRWTDWGQEGRGRQRRGGRAYTTISSIAGTYVIIRR